MKGDDRKERSGGNRTETDLLPSQRWGVLTRADVEELAALIAGLHDWTSRLVWLCEHLNDTLTVGKGPPPPSKLSFYAHVKSHAADRQQDLFAIADEALEALVEEE